MKIQMLLTGPFRDELVTAEIVDVAPHLWGTFAVHRVPQRTHLWRVSHVESGGGAGPLKPTKDSAVRSARALLREKTPADLLRGFRICAAQRPDVYADAAEFLK